MAPRRRRRRRPHRPRERDEERLWRDGVVVRRELDRLMLPACRSPGCDGGGTAGTSGRRCCSRCCCRCCCRSCRCCSLAAAAPSSQPQTVVHWASGSASLRSWWSCCVAAYPPPRARPHCQSRRILLEALHVVLVPRARLPCGAPSPCARRACASVMPSVVCAAASRAAVSRGDGLRSSSPTSAPRWTRPPLALHLHQQ